VGTFGSIAASVNLAWESLKPAQARAHIRKGPAIPNVRLNVDEAQISLQPLDAVSRHEASADRYIRRQALATRECKIS
jgi:hypothetical protein